MAGVNEKRASYPGELVNPILENENVPDNEGSEHQKTPIQKNIPSNPGAGSKAEVVEEEESEEDSDSES